MSDCQKNCPRFPGETDSTSSHPRTTADPKSGNNQSRNERIGSPLQSQKSVNIVDTKDSLAPRPRSERRNEKEILSANNFTAESHSGKISGHQMAENTSGNPGTSSGSRIAGNLNSNPTAKERALRRAEERRAKYEEYLLTKGFRYFDQFCHCRVSCLLDNFRRDEFVISIIKSFCFFGFAMKLINELDGLTIIN
ncbi:uncharacterized protein LOC105688001 [Athalia rosae]|uniref:uncharacterized protein LOC105688001 n=1 Tax=Athalia rosae TaxID=37344 RepID=UPI0020346C5A|nr:uncharacterized protein LOC105688001 [Athalia rosae]